MNIVVEIKEQYENIKNIIVLRLDEFNNILENGKDHELFEELIFCLLTPQSSAQNGMIAVANLLSNEVLYKGEFEDIVKYLNIVRFKNNKTKYILEARKLFYGEEKRSIREILDSFNSIFEIRSWFVKNIKGIGFKEASHFLRNIGLGEHLAILDRHILKNMLNFGIIDSIPKTITPKKYIEMEIKLTLFSKKINIPLSHLDLLFWHNEVGKILK